MERISEEEVFMQVAELFAKRSTCCRVQVGAVIVKDRRIISTGFNGVPSGMMHCCDHFSNYEPVDKIPPEISEAYERKEQWAIEEVNLLNELHTESFKKTHGRFSEENEIHAEQNAISFAARYGIETKGCDLYTTVSPCLSCSKIIIAAGIDKIIYRNLYDRDIRGLDLLSKAGVKLIHLES